MRSEDVTPKTMLSLVRLPRLIIALLAICWLLSSCGVSAERQQDKTPVTQSPTSANQDVRKKAKVDPNKFALVVAGVGGEEAYTKKFTAQAMRLYEALTLQLGFDEKNVFLLTENPTGGPEDGTTSKIATADEVRKAFSSIKSAASAESLTLVVLIGHGSFDNQQAKFNLVGPDLSAKDYSTLIAALPTRKVVFINCASASGEFIKPLSAAGRIVITATRSGNEQNATIFAAHFITGLTDPAADADKNGRISLLEAFNYATKLTEDWYKAKNSLATEHALLDDNGDGVGHEQATGGDGALAKVSYLDSKQIEEAAGDAELTRLIGERQRLEAEVEKLKARKAEMKPEEYDTELERLLVELAKVSQEIKAKRR